MFIYLFFLFSIGMSWMKRPSMSLNISDSPGPLVRFLSVCLSVWLSVRPSVCLSACLSCSLSCCLPVRLSAYPSICLSVCLSVCLSACLSFFPSPCDQSVVLPKLFIYNVRLVEVQSRSFLHKLDKTRDSREFVTGSNLIGFKYNLNERKKNNSDSIEHILSTDEDFWYEVGSGHYQTCPLLLNSAFSSRNF